MLKTIHGDSMDLVGKLYQLAWPSVFPRCVGLISLANSRCWRFAAVILS